MVTSGVLKLLLLVLFSVLIFYLSTSIRTRSVPPLSSLTNVSSTPTTQPTAMTAAPSSAAKSYSEISITTFNRSSHVTNKNSPKQSRHANNTNVYVCITGQLSRLELQNKIDKLFLPLHNRGYHLYIGLALTTDNVSHFSNNDNGDKMQLFTSIAQVRQALFDVKGVLKVRHFRKVNNIENITVNTKYVNSLRAKPGENTTITTRRFVYQLRVLQYCYHWSKMATYSSFFIRLREDTFIDHINLDPIVKKAQDGAVVTTACDAWRGMNDKMAFGPSLRAKDFFILPYQYYLSFEKVIENFNSEQLYKKCYVKNGFNITATDDYVVTKAITIKHSEQSLNVSGPWNCTVTGNPFLKWSVNCPKEGLSGAPPYIAECHKSIHS